MVPREGVPPFRRPAEMARMPWVFFLVGLPTRARLSLPFPSLLLGVFCAGAPGSSEETLAPPGSPQGQDGCVGKWGPPECPGEPLEVKAGSEESGSLDSPRRPPPPAPLRIQRKVLMGEGSVQKAQSRRIHIRRLPSSPVLGREVVCGGQ